MENFKLFSSFLLLVLVMVVSWVKKSHLTKKQSRNQGVHSERVQLKPDEKLIYTCKPGFRFILYMYSISVMTLFIICIPVLFFGMFIHVIAGNSISLFSHSYSLREILIISPIILLIIPIIIFTIVIFPLSKLIKKYYYLFTDKRCVLYLLIAKEKDNIESKLEIFYSNITNVSIMQNWLQKLFGIASISIIDKNNTSAVLYIPRKIKKEPYKPPCIRYITVSEAKKVVSLLRSYTSIT